MKIWILKFMHRPGGSPYLRYTRMCHLTGMVWRKIALHKGPDLKFCLTKGSHFGSKSALQKGPFSLKTEVSPLKNAYFANFKRKIFCKSPESYILGTFCLLFLKFALKQGQNFGADAPYRRVGFEIPKWHTRVQKSGKSPPPRGCLPDLVLVLCSSIQSSAHRAVLL